MDETITIKKAWYDNLMRHYRLLQALQDCGVNNWEGYSEAINIAFPDGDEDED